MLQIASLKAHIILHVLSTHFPTFSAIHLEYLSSIAEVKSLILPSVHYLQNL